MDIVRYLIKHGANVLIRNSSGSTNILQINFHYRTVYLQGICSVFLSEIIFLISPLHKNLKSLSSLSSLSFVFSCVVIIF